MATRVFRRRTSSLIAALVVAAATWSCDARTVPPSATAPPPTAPLMRYQSQTIWELDGSTWTFYGSVNPNGSPTDVVLEVGSGTEEAPTFDRELPVAEGLILPEAFEFETSALNGPFCVRFTARNEVGATSTPAFCPEIVRRSFRPDPTAAPSPSG